MFQKLSHISTNHQQKIKRFSLRIPESRTPIENGTIKRVCTAPTIEECMTAHPSIWYIAHEYPKDRRADPYSIMDSMNTLLDHGETTGFLFRCYDFLVEAKSIITPEEIHANRWVPDVLETNEHWIIKDIEPFHSYYVFLTHTEFIENKQRFEYTIFQNEEIGRIADGDYHWKKESDLLNQQSMEEWEKEQPLQPHPSAEDSDQDVSESDILFHMQTKG